MWVSWTRERAVGEGKGHGAAREVGRASLVITQLVGLDEVMHVKGLA